jgi:hypothetical protein
MIKRSGLFFSAICLISVLFLLVACGNSESHNEVLKSIDSPGGKYSAVIFIRDMGATTKESYQLSIIRREDSLDDSPGNIFICYGKFDVEWNNSNSITVTREMSGEIFKQKSRYKGIEIKYVEGLSTAKITSVDSKWR